MVAVLSVYVADPQFQGQTKERLNNPEVTAQVDGVVRLAVEKWFHDNRTSAEAVVARAILAARAREASRAAIKEVQRKTAVSHKNLLPGKLADCSSTEPPPRARSSSSRATRPAAPPRWAATAAPRPSSAARQGAEHRERSPPRSDAERGAAELITAHRCGVGPEYSEERLRLPQGLISATRTTTGNHISTLILTFFYRTCRR